MNGDGGTAAERPHLDEVVGVGCEEGRDVGGEAEEVAAEAGVGEASMRRPSRVWLDDNWARISSSEASEAADEVGVGETKRRRPSRVSLDETWIEMERAVQREAKKDRDALLCRVAAVIALMRLRRKRAQVLQAAAAPDKCAALPYPRLPLPWLPFTTATRLGEGKTAQLLDPTQ